MYYTYMVRCQDNSIYTGITNNLTRRMNEHINKTKKCAKYTYNHKALTLEIAWSSENRSLATKLEYYIKRLSKENKENLIKTKELSIVTNIEMQKYTLIEETNIIKIIKETK